MRGCFKDFKQNFSLKIKVRYCLSLPPQNVNGNLSPLEVGGKLLERVFLRHLNKAESHLKRPSKLLKWAITCGKLLECVFKAPE